MGFSIFHALGGAAERGSELFDEARKDAVDIAKTTMKYRAEEGMAAKKKLEAKYQSDLKIGQRLVQDYNFKVSHVGALASMGELENVYGKIKQTKPGEIDPDAIVTVFDNKDPKKDLSQYLRDIVIGTPNVTSKAVERDLSGMNMFQRAGVAAAQNVIDPFYKGLGTTEGEMTAYTYDDFTRETVGGSINQARLDLIGADTRVPYRQGVSEALKTLGDGIGINLYVDTAYNVITQETSANKEKAFKNESVIIQKLWNKKYLESGGDYAATSTEVKEYIMSPEYKEDAAKRGVTVDFSIKPDRGVPGATGIGDAFRVKIQNAHSKEAVVDLIEAIKDPAFDSKKDAWRKLLRSYPSTISQADLNKIKDVILGEPSTETDSDSTETDSTSSEPNYKKKYGGMSEPVDNIASVVNELQNSGVDTSNPQAVESALMARASKLGGNIPEEDLKGMVRIATEQITRVA